MRSTIIIILAGMIFGCTGNAEKSTIVKSQSIQLSMDSLVAENNIPGLNFSIIYPDGHQENYSSGYADLTNEIPLSANHVMFSGSVGKTYAVAVLMQLLEEGKVGLHDRFIDYFPDSLWLYDLPNIQDITIKMLLSHTSGLPRYVMKQEVWDSIRINPDKVWTYEDRLLNISGDDAVHLPGEGWSYSDSNYILLGMLIEMLSGTYYYEEVSSRLLDPLSLDDTHASLKRDIVDLPVGYSRLPDFGIPEEVVVDGVFIFNPQMEWTGGGFASTTPDLVRWAKYYYDGGVISDTVLKSMITPCEQGKDLGNNTAYGMGTFIFQTTVGEAWGHTGFMPGFNSIFAWFPNAKIAVAMQSNCDYAGSKMALISYVERILNNVLID